MNSNLTMGSLFAGIGGFEEAGRRNDIKTLWNCEIDPFKRKILKKNFPDAYQYGDIREVKNPPSVDILTGGFPCQDLSIANQSKKGVKGIDGHRSGLWKEYARILGEVRPRVIVFENSPMLLVSGLEHVLCDLSRSGYMCEWRCFYATQWGFPHGRKRIYGIAYSIGFGWEDHIKTSPLLQKVLPERTPRQDFVPVSFKRYDRHSDYESVRMDDGFSQELDKGRIHGCGNAIVVDIGEAILKQIKLHWPQ
ncbi:hypothetical protein GCM10027299_09540 [Larkinella ripae]